MLLGQQLQRSKEVIFEHLIQKWSEHFSKAVSTHFVSEPIADLVRPFKLNQCFQEVLNGDLL